MTAKGTVLSEEQRAVLRDRLAKAREAKKLKPKVVSAAAPEVRLAPTATHAPWTENHWMSAPIEDCRTRLAALRADFETGGRIVGQRSDMSDPRSYKCFVCSAPIPEISPSGRGPGWVWKHDYLDPKTGLYQSVVICSQRCHTVYSNDTRLQMALKDLMQGKVSAPPEAA
jgi:hypothetical protein